MLRTQFPETEAPAPPTQTTNTAPHGWWRVTGVSAVTLLVLITAFLVVPQAILTKLSSPPRSVRVWLAAAWVASAFALACYSAWRYTAPSARRSE